jgi:hypothetical protein
MDVRVVLLRNRREGVNSMTISEHLSDVTITDIGLHITALDNGAPVAISPVTELVYSMFLHAKVTEILKEVVNWTGFTRNFTHLKSNTVIP